MKGQKGAKIVNEATGEKTPKITLQGYIDIPDVDLEAVILELPKHIVLTQQEPGCISFEVLQEAKNSVRFSVYEEFENEAAFERHQERVNRSLWGRLTRNASRNYTITKL